MVVGRGGGGRGGGGGVGVARRAPALLGGRGAERDGAALVEEVAEVVDVGVHDGPRLDRGGGEGGRRQEGVVWGDGGLRHLGGIPQEELQCVVQDVARPWSAVGQVGLVQHAECFS